VIGLSILRLASADHIKLQYFFANLCFDMMLYQHLWVVVKTMAAEKARKKGDITLTKKCNQDGISVTSQRHLLLTMLKEATDYPDVEPSI